MSDKRSDQLWTNQKWLLGHIDTVHDSLCHGLSGTWQDRTVQAANAAKVAGILLRDISLLHVNKKLKLPREIHARIVNLIGAP